MFQDCTGIWGPCLGCATKHAFLAFIVDCLCWNDPEEQASTLKCIVHPIASLYITMPLSKWVYRWRVPLDELAVCCRLAGGPWPATGAGTGTGTGIRQPQRASGDPGSQPRSHAEGPLQGCPAGTHAAACRCGCPACQGEQPLLPGNVKATGQVWCNKSPKISLVPGSETPFVLKNLRAQVQAKWHCQNLAQMC